MNGYTPTPKNAERIAYDEQRAEYFEGRSMAFSFACNFSATEEDADRLHELIVAADTDPAHILNANKEVDWMEWAEEMESAAKDWQSQVTELRGG